MKNLIWIVFLACSASVSAQGFYDWNHIPEIKLYFEKSNWAEILTKMKDADSEQRLSASMMVDGVKYEGVGVRFKGNSSFKNVKKSGAKKLPFNIKVNYQNKDQKLSGNYETIKLSNCFRDPSFIREILSYEIGRKYLPSPKSNFAKLYINEEYIGLYSNAESVDEEFLKREFDEDKGAFFKCDPEFGNAKKPLSTCKAGDKSSLMYLGDHPLCYQSDYEMKSDSGWNQLIDLMRTLQTKPDKIDPLLQVDLVLWMHAFNNVLVNLDSYTGRLSHNYYLYQTRTGQFCPILWDMNLSFGGFQYDGVSAQALSKEELQTMSPFIHYKNKNPKRPLIVNLLNNSFLRKVYVAHLRTIVEENFANGAYLKRAEEISKLIEQEVKADPNKLYSFEAFEKNLNETVNADGTPIIGVAELMQKRTEYLTSHPLLQQVTPEVKVVEHFQFGNTLAVQATLEGAEKAWLFYKTAKKEPFKSLEMKDNGGNNDVQPKDGIWGATIDFKKGTVYYVVAENEQTVKLSPQRASYEYYKVD